MVLRRNQSQSSAEKHFSAKLASKLEEPDMIDKVLSPTVYELKYSPVRIPKVHAVDLIRLETYTSCQHLNSKQTESENSQINSTFSNEKVKKQLPRGSDNKFQQMAEEPGSKNKRRRGRSWKQRGPVSNTDVEYNDGNKRYNLHPRRQ